MATTEDIVSMVELKELARRLLASNSILRSVILSEPDFLPRAQALAKLQVYIMLLYKERIER